VRDVAGYLALAAPPTCYYCCCCCCFCCCCCCGPVPGPRWCPGSVPGGPRWCPGSVPGHRGPREVSRDTVGHGGPSLGHGGVPEVFRVGHGGVPEVSRDTVGHGKCPGTPWTIHRSFIHSFIDSFIHSIIRSLIHHSFHSFVHSFVRSFIIHSIHSFIHSVSHSFIHSVGHSDTLGPREVSRDTVGPREASRATVGHGHSFIPSFVHSFLHSFIHSSVIRSFIYHSFHSFVYSFSQSATHVTTKGKPFFSCMPACMSNARSTQPRLRSPLVERAARRQAVTRGFNIFAGHAQERSSRRANCASDSHISRAWSGGATHVTKSGVAVPPRDKLRAVTRETFFPARLRVGETLAAHSRGCPHLW